MPGFQFTPGSAASIGAQAALHLPAGPGAMPALTRTFATLLARRSGHVRLGLGPQPGGVTAAAANTMAVSNGLAP